ncbi:MAG: response regulator [Verrucomicrobiota bacterium]
MSEPLSNNTQPVVLLVEDDLDIRSYIKLGLRSDYKIIEADNGQLGLKQALERKPDLIITDIMMPGVNGLELCHRLKQNPETSYIPVVMLTVQSTDSDQLKGLESGADDYLIKPFNLQILKARIANLLKSRQLLSHRLDPQNLAEEEQLIIENAGDQAFWEKVRKIVEANFRKSKFNTDQLADELNISLRSLQRKFKTSINQSPKDFINEFRMKRAAELLISTKTTINEVAFLVGFEESSSFSRMFKKHFGQSPKLYKESYLSKKQ